jgi:hypothetical protein
MRICNKQLGRGIAKLVAVFVLVGSTGTITLAEKVRGTKTCTAGSYSRTIGGKAHTCTSKCTTPVTETTCNPNCSSTVSIETSYEGCTANATAPSNQNFGAFPSGGLLATDGGGLQGGGRPGAVGQAVRPPVAATTPKFQ